MRQVLRRATLFAVLFGSAGAGMTDAQTPEPPASAPDSVAVVPGPRYEAGGLHRFLFGDNHRQAWTTTIQVPVLDLGRFAGGLTPTEVGGGMQTRSLHLETDDGREFVFRSVDKDATESVPPDLRGSLMHKLFQDQISALHPAGALVVSGLLEAAGIAHSSPVLMVMPDDPLLGEFREEFTGMLGLLEERPNEGPDDTRGFAGSSKIVGTDKMFERINADPVNRPAALAYLEARLFDMWVNDWDRHMDQWRWAFRARGGDSLWMPVPRDRDQAFVNFDGFFFAISRRVLPEVIPFDSTYSSLEGYTGNSHDLDSRVLAGVERAVYDSLARHLQARFTGPVIGRAMTRLPSALRALDSAAIAGRLQARLGDLDELAEKFYIQQAGIVDVHATDASEVAILEGHPDGGITLSVREVRESPDGGSEAWYQRRFHPSETDELRVYLHDGDDRAELRGEGPGDITVRLIGGNGTNDLPETDAGWLHVYDRGPTRGIEDGPDDALDRREWVRISADTLEPPPPDRGGYVAPMADVSYEDDLGLVVMAGLQKVGHGFRKYPYAGSTRIWGRYGTGYDVSEVHLAYDRRREASDWHILIETGWSQFGVLRFHGFGNETGGEGGAFEVRRGEYHLRPALAWSRMSGTSVSAGPVIRHGTVDRESGSFITSLSRYGDGTVTQAGLSMMISRDSRDSPNYASRGMLATAQAEFYPGLLDLDEAYGAVEGELRLYQSLPGPTDPVLALRVGGRKLWGAFPFYDAAFIGGPGTVRSFPHQRYAGDASAYGGAELRVPVGSVPLYVFPVRLLFFGFGDAGRVFVDGGSSGEWHASWGGGVSFGFLTPTNNLTVALANSEERTSLYLSLGFDY